MERGIARQWVRTFVLAGVIALLGAGAVAPAAARPAPSPSVDIHSVAGLSPDGRSITVQVLASCPERWAVVEAVISVSQPQASGQASFPLRCIGSLRSFWVSVPSSGGTFDLSDAQASASVVISRGKTLRAQDSQVLTVEPRVSVELGETAQLEPGGEAVVIAVTVACPVGTTGRQSSLNISQNGRASGNGSYLPVCDGTPHTFSVRVEASQGVYEPGIAQALTFANIEHEGEIFVGIDDDGALELVS
jgi:hypothetical protein